MMFAQNVYAKGSKGFIQSRAEQVQIEKALAELEALRNIRKLDKEQIEALNQKIVALEDLVKIERQRAEAYRQADSERASANTLDAQRIALYEKIVADYKTERERLMKERDRARRNGQLLGLGGFVLGVLAAVFVKRE